MIRQRHPKYSTNSAKSNQGFTLVEMLVTISIMAIIASFAVPSFNRQIADKRVKSAASVIESALKTAVSESAIRRRPITFTINGNNITLQDQNVKPKAELVQSYDYNSNIEVELSTGAPITFMIGPGKRVRNAAGEPITMTFSICDSNASGEVKRLVSLNALAQVRQSTDGSCL